MRKLKYGNCLVISTEKRGKYFEDHFCESLNSQECNLFSQLYDIQSRHTFIYIIFFLNPKYSWILLEICTGNFRLRFWHYQSNYEICCNQNQNQLIKKYGNLRMFSPRGKVSILMSFHCAVCFFCSKIQSCRENLQHQIACSEWHWREREAGRVSDKKMLLSRFSLKIY